MTNPNEPRTKLDFLYQEVLGDVVDTVKRIEHLGAKLDSINKNSDTVKSVLEEFPAHLYESLTKSSKVISENAAKSVGNTLTNVELQLNELSKNSAKYAAIAHASAKKTLIYMLCISALSGVLGGLVVGVALVKAF